MSHEIFMRRALDLAALATGNTHPNPVVGCVLVHQQKIIAEGYHTQAGTPHAEVNAINALENKNLLPHTTLYVTLEPCAHYGKTPPCADFIIHSGITHVVVGTTDPNPQVAGKGIKKLQNAGITVIKNILKNECLEINRHFFWSITRHQPYIILKWAQTADGYIARPDHTSQWITNLHSRTYTHQLRTRHAAILIGSNTALHDNPRLNARLWQGTQPTRIIIDNSQKIPRTHHIFDGTQPTLIFQNNETPAQIVAALHQQNIQSLMVEGGSHTLQKFIDAQLWNEAYIFEAPKVFFENGIKAPILPKNNLCSTQYFGDNLLNIHKNTINLVNYH
jgi:diaminohydroxyphosphoribosylaminopyrimidine deaminase/5-amino-6-(5-phosphoribosylamino)uracil reductase